jgi:hypothetical protein
MYTKLYFYHISLISPESEIFQIKFVQKFETHDYIQSIFFEYPAV